jgi:hypothetical protein
MIIKNEIGKTREYKTKTQNLNRQLRIGIIVDVRSVTTVELHKLIVGLLINAPDSLFEYMGNAQDQTVMTRHFNVMRGLKQCYRPLISEFDEQMTRGWKALLLGKSGPSLQSIGDKPAEIMDCFSRRANEQFGPLLEILETHIAELIDVEDVFHPLSPDYLLLSFWHGTRKLGLNREERLLVVPLFSRFVIDRLGIILATANDMLVNRVEYADV